jgi:hypothetical protein
MEHNARFVKREVMKCPGVGPMITAHGYMESRAIKKGKRLLSGGWLRFLSKHPGR